MLSRGDYPTFIHSQNVKNTSSGVFGHFRTCVNEQTNFIKPDI